MLNWNAMLVNSNNNSLLKINNNHVQDTEWFIVDKKMTTDGGSLEDIRYKISKPNLRFILIIQYMEIKKDIHENKIFNNNIKSLLIYGYENLW